MIEGLDPLYFANDKTWQARRQDWEAANSTSGFLSANVDDLLKRLKGDKSCARCVINIGASRLLGFLRMNRYQNQYLWVQDQAKQPRLGSAPPPTVEKQRIEVDDAFNLAPAHEYFFAAVSMEGTGVRYYGEYCMVLSELQDQNPQIVDRDSYEILVAPLQSRPRPSFLPALVGRWNEDLNDIAVMKVRAVLAREERITTNIVQCRALLEGEEYIEVHLHLPSRDGTQPGFSTEFIKEVRQDSREVACGERINTLLASRQPPRIEDYIFTLRRNAVETELQERAIPSRVVREERMA